MDEDIAVVGIGCNFPGGEGLDSFWKVLLDGKNCATEIPEDRFDLSQWYDPDNTILGKTQTTKAAFIDGFNEFDHKFFGISETEANVMDPQQKLLLQCCYRALEDAGIPMENISGSRTGVYIGLMNRDYETLLNNSAGTITHYNGTGTAMSIAANRISYTFNLTGPSFAIDSACSSSLVALHSACQAIKQGDCEMALCGGVSCILEPRVFVALNKAKMISPEGISKPFSSTADGYGRGEGCGIVLLKPFKKALENFHHIWGIICKTAVNQDGHTVTPITKPSMVQQEKLLHGIYSTETYLSDVQYIEAHGTGTSVGDPIEAGSISKVIAKARSADLGPLCIGSVKSNIGHTESAAGVAGLIKVLLMMKHQTIVPSLFYSEESSSIDAQALNLKIPTRAERWHCTSSMGRVAGINSFGFGGTNAHAIVREYRCAVVSSSYKLSSKKLFPLSAASSKSLELCIADTQQRIMTDHKTDIQGLLYTSACRRSHTKHKYRKVFITTSLSHLEEQLKAGSNKKVVAVKPDPRVVFVFCGNGVTYGGMCKQLLKEEPVFQEKMREVENYFQKYKPISILQKIETGFDNDDFSKPDIVQPLLFATQVATAHLLKHWGVRPAAVLGHSVGEVAAAHCSGLLSLNDAVKVIYYRSVLQTKVTGGKMLVVGNAAVSDILKILPSYAGKICLAAYNSPLSCVLSGEKDAVENVYQVLKTSLKGKNVFLHVLEVPAAYHSHMMNPILSQIKDSIGSLKQHKLDCELVSTVTGKAYCLGDFVTGDYWARNIRNAVTFEQALRVVANKKKNTVFVEIGPRRALQRNILETLGNDTVVLSSVQPDKDHETILTAVSKLFELGVNVDWDQLYSGFESLPASYPVYQFDCLKNETRFEDVRQGNDAVAHCPHPLINLHKRNSGMLKCSLSSDVAPYLWEHKSNGIVIAPGALYVELALASGTVSVIPKMPLSSLQLTINFQNLLVLTKGSHLLEVQLEQSEDEVLFQIQSSAAVHSSGSIVCRRGPAMTEHQTILLDTIFKRCSLVIAGEQVYHTLNQAGFEYGPTFRQLGDIHYGEEFKEAVTTLMIPDELLRQLYEYCVHPAVLDSFFQMSSVLVLSNSTIRHGFPTTVGSIVIVAPLCKEMVIYMRVTQEMPEYFEVCGCFSDTKGHTLIELKRVRITFLVDSMKITESCFFHNERRTAPANTKIYNKPKAVVFEDSLGITTALKPYLHPSSVFFSPVDLRSTLHASDLLLQCDQSTADTEKVLFIWNFKNLSHLKTQTVLEHLVDICDLFRQVVLTLRNCKHLHTVHVITYRSSESTVDHISPGFVLSGLTRACAAELSELSLQLIDLATVSNEDIQALASVIGSYKSNEYPEVTISKGQIQSTVIARTPINLLTGGIDSFPSEHVTLQTANPYRMTCLSAITTSVVDLTEGKYVQVQLCKICVHSPDYFPVSISNLNFGQTLYWDKYTSQNHKLLALDFSGTVTAVGQDVRKLKVGDHIVSCYPSVATSKIILPEDACYKTKRLQFMENIPCVSYFVLAWEILCNALPKAKPNTVMCIFSTVTDSALVKVLMFTAKKSGWNIFTETETSGLIRSLNQCPVFVLIPPYDRSCLAQLGNIARAKHTFLVLEEGSKFSPSGFVLNENVCFHFLKLCTIFQKSRLRTHRAQIYKWLRLMQLDNTCLSLRSNTYQVTPPEIMTCETTDVESYFNTKTVSLIVLHNSGSVADTSHICLQPQPKQLFTKTSVYIISGGLSGLGLETVKFISHWGGRCIVTLSRSVPSTETQLQISSLQKRYGLKLITLQCDVSVSEQVVEAFAVIGQKFPSCPIKGVFHSAAVLHDGLLETLDKSLFEKVLRPKVSGALNLHFATLNSHIDYFVCYSSISSFIGNASQANYAAANSFLDTLCHYRRNLGLAGQSINWGPLNLGLLLNKEGFQKFLEAKGLMIMELPEIHEALKQCLLANKPQQVICKFNYRNLRNNVLSQNASLKVRLTTLVERELENKVIYGPMKELQSSLDDYVRGILSDICNVAADDVEDETVLASVGIDSMLAMTMQNQMFQETGVNVPLVALLDPNSTLSSLIKHLKEANNGYKNDTYL
ncbi:phenolphthiocerol/phthiocerol polyketide synthase subunit C [Brachyhypopomus gauderio]|uniref:phenolphthiocerol/phthiocerol polyketide synthase subunit C n=1 Tax=Brachyhypopomus gauderio TaxID=698409 RepID=UPI004041DE4C